MIAREPAVATLAEVHVMTEVERFPRPVRLAELLEHVRSTVEAGPPDVHRARAGHIRPRASLRRHARYLPAPVVSGRALSRAHSFIEPSNNRTS